MAVEGKVAKILGNNEIVINRGRNEGVRQGMLFEVFAPEGEEVWDPDTGETLGTVEDVKAHAEVIEVKERLAVARRSEEHTSELQSRQYLVCRLLLEKKKTERSHEHA